MSSKEVQKSPTSKQIIIKPAVSKPAAGKTPQKLHPTQVNQTNQTDQTHQTDQT